MLLFRPLVVHTYGKTAVWRRFTGSIALSTGNVGFHFAALWPFEIQITPVNPYIYGIPYDEIVWFISPPPVGVSTDQIGYAIEINC